MRRENTSLRDALVWILHRESHGGSAAGVEEALSTVRMMAASNGESFDAHRARVAVRVMHSTPHAILRVLDRVRVLPSGREAEVLVVRALAARCLHARAAALSDRRVASLAAAWDDRPLCDLVADAAAAGAGAGAALARLRRGS